MAFAIRSAAFADGAAVPRDFTCDGANTPPPLEWRDPPSGTRSFALIVDDPDAPRGTFTHWLLYDIPATSTAIDGDRVGKPLANDFGNAGYGGPCPPRGAPHHYVFTLYAVDVPSLHLKGKSRKHLERALEGHTVGTARMTGVYKRG